MRSTPLSSATSVADREPDRGLLREQNLGVMASIQGDLDSALVRYNDSLRAFQKAEDQEGTCWVLNNLGILLTTLDKLDDADTHLNRPSPLLMTELMKLSRR